MLHVAFEFIGKMIIASANVKFLILCMKENSLVRVLTLGLWPNETNLYYYTFFLCPALFLFFSVGVINAEMA